MKAKPDLSRLWEFDRGLRPGAGWLAGIDEAGRGPLAGNVVAACVIFDARGETIPGVHDSKQLSPAAREALFPILLEKASAYGIGAATAEEIDSVNILQATFLAMRRALESMSLRPGLLLVDGNQKIPGVEVPQQTLVGGDGLSASIAAASILAKVTRDRELEALDAQYPQYGFSKHKGYGTAQHRDALRRHGLSPVHRRSFCSAFSFL